MKQKQPGKKNEKDPDWVEGLETRVDLQGGADQLFSLEKGRPIKSLRVEYYTSGQKLKRKQKDSSRG